MGMEIDLVEKISGLSKEEMSEVVDRKEPNNYNSFFKKKHDSY